MMLVGLGRYGDIVNALPLAYALSRQIGRVDWLVSNQYAGIFEGVSYVRPVIWQGGQDTLPVALGRYRGAQMRVVQAWLNPDNRRLTASYALEQWRLGGTLEQFNQWPLIFDRAHDNRAQFLKQRVLCDAQGQRPLILCCVDGVSSPFTQGARLLAMLRGLDADVIDMRDVRAVQVFDLLPLFSSADCLVTIDTLPLHLARAAQCPVVSVLNQGWLGSVPPPQSLASFTYGHDLEEIVERTWEIVRKPLLRTVVVAANVFDNGDRAQRARETWPRTLAPVFTRTSQAIGDTRALPFMRDYLRAGLDRTRADVIIWTNDDVSFLPGGIEKIKAHARKFDFGCSRRDAQHIGREVFWFSRAWLREHIDELPDVILAAPQQDLVMAKWLRAQRGLKTTMENLLLDMPPVELPPGIVAHEEHPSRWLQHQESASARHNAMLFAQ